MIIAWVYKGWICSGESDGDGGMTNAGITDDNGLVRVYDGLTFKSEEEFRAYISRYVD